MIKSACASAKTVSCLLRDVADVCLNLCTSIVQNVVLYWNY